MGDSLDEMAGQCHSPLDFDKNRCTGKWCLSRGGLMGVLTKIFTWWNGATIGTLWHIFRKGVFVGEDKQGNKYYREKAPKSGKARRWVVYNGTAEASRVSPDWHGWLHYTFDEPPTLASFSKHEWEKAHIPNVTGTPFAYHPEGSLNRGGQRPQATGDYEAWEPN